MNAVRILVTLGAIAYVVGEIQWRDEYRTESGVILYGKLVKIGADQFQFVADGGQTFAVTEPRNPDESNPFIPGFVTLLKRTNFILFGGAILLYPVSFVLLALRWQWLLDTHGLDPGTKEALRLTWIGLLANHVLPSSTGGDFVKAVCICRRAPGKKTAAAMTVLVDRVVGLISLMIIGATAIYLQQGKQSLIGPGRFVGWGLIGITTCGVIYFSGRIRRFLRIDRLIAILPMSEKFKKLDDSLFHYRRHILALIQVLLISFLIHGWTIWCVYLIGKSLGLNVGIIHFCAFLPVIFTVGALMPSIAGLGVLEGGFQKFFSLPGVGATPASAVAMCILYRIMVLISSLPGALPLYREMSAPGGSKILHPEEES